MIIAAGGIIVDIEELTGETVPFRAVGTLFGALFDFMA